MDLSSDLAIHDGNGRGSTPVRCAAGCIRNLGLIRADGVASKKIYATEA
jgi:hypothetical protein